MRIRDVSILLLSAALGGAAVSPGKAGEILDTPAALPEGMRAVSISVDSLPGDAPNVGPGDRVDILLTPTPEYQSGSGVILQGILVIAVSKKEDTGAGWPFNEQTVVVDIDAVQAQKLAIARQIGRLSAMPSEPPLCLSDFFSMCGGGSGPAAQPVSGPTVRSRYHSVVI